MVRKFNLSPFEALRIEGGDKTRSTSCVSSGLHLGRWSRRIPPDQVLDLGLPKINANAAGDAVFLDGNGHRRAPSHPPRVCSTMPPRPGCLMQSIASDVLEIGDESDQPGNQQDGL